MVASKVVRPFQCTKPWQNLNLPAVATANRSGLNVSDYGKLSQHGQCGQIFGVALGSGRDINPSNGSGSMEPLRTMEFEGTIPLITKIENASGQVVKSHSQIETSAQ